MNIQTVDIGLLSPNPANPRREVDDCWELATSIRQVGLLNPLIVQADGDGYRIIAGHRRHVALQLLSGVNPAYRDIPCVIRPAAEGPEELLLMLIENAQRVDLDPIDKGRAYKILKDLGLSQEAIGRRVGVSQHTVSEYLRLLELPQEHQDRVREGSLSVKKAAQLRGKLLGSARRAGRAVNRAIDRSGNGVPTTETYEDCPHCAGTGKVRKVLATCTDPFCRPDKRCRACVHRMAQEDQERLEALRAEKAGRV